MALKYEIDAEAILAQLKGVKEDMEKDLSKAVQNLATLAKAKIAQSTDSLSSANRKLYNESLEGPIEVATNVYVVALDEKAMWIEEGAWNDEHDMKPKLLKGKKYRVIPFHYDRPQSQNSPQTQALVNEIAQKLKKEKLSITKLEKDENGSPRVGKLHEFDFGGEKLGRGNTPALQKLSIYQSKDKTTGKMRRDVLTFRTVSSGPASEGKWIHPGYEAKKFMDKAMDEIIKEWEQRILPEFIDKWSGK